MSIMKMYVEEYLAAEQVAENRYIIHLSNGKEIEVTEHPVHNGNMLTGKRILLHKKREKPDICGYACRFPGKCNSALCSDCPVAEAFFAERDGVELVYAI